MKKVVIVYEYFYPGFRAGGPVQSLTNLIKHLPGDYDFYVITSSRDLGESEAYPNVNIDAWNEVKLTPEQQAVKVWYSSGLPPLRKLLVELNPEIVYINGMFSRWSMRLFILKKWGRLKKIKFIAAPRGMLQKGALAVKHFKKASFLLLFKYLGLHKNILWHATDAQEQKDLLRVFGNRAAVVVAANIPKAPLAWNRRIKDTGKLDMIFFSLVTQKKNLHVVLEALRKIEIPIQFHIYGPVKDQDYWERCQTLFEGQKHEIKYFGAINPIEVQHTLSTYDVMILPTKGENFGHAIYESLSVGTPVITSPYTPWGKLQDVRAGITVETFDQQDWATTIQFFIDLNQEKYSVYSQGACSLAKTYFLNNDFKVQYQNLFS